ncbi:MAG TPA: MOSC and FAD-binding oxidoreductase domain-containing protein [Solirubrobacteraceae bacterium]|nr:MOSC and FAD-binding oxidoreductase domain-containing protein [Solirubrobacteraceae bacterium]
MSRVQAAETEVGRLLSVNVGGPREVQWQGNAVRTAIWKSPVQGPRMVRQINIDGDDQADRNAHGGEHRAVFVYQIESYRYWERELGRDDFSYGQFGENFTVEGLSDEDVCIGDRYRIGDAVFEVTQPRVTCFRVGIRLDDPRMPSLLVAHHRPGFYFRVLREGEVQAGDEIVLVQQGPERLSVAETDALLYLPNKSRRTLQRALRIPALSEGWRGSFQELLEHDGKAQAPERVAWPGFVRLTIVDIHRESDAIVSFTLAPADGSAPAASVVKPGQYLTFRLRPHGPDAAAVVRSYSLSAVVDNRYRISVKLEPHGLGSGFLQQRVRVGDTVEAAAPRGDFTLRDGTRPIALISAGVGATPVLAMLQALATSGDEREVWWLHGARNRASHAFGAEVDQLLGRLPHAHRVVTYSRPRPGEIPGVDFDAVGRLSVETITEAGVPRDADYYLCGPTEFMSSLSAALVAHGVAPERVARETFGAVAAGARPPGMEAEQPPPHPPAGEPGTGPAVTFSRSGLTVAWDPSYGNLLELAEACDVPVSFGCRTGVCHYCESGLLTGSVDYVTEPLDAPDAEHVLMCCAQPASEVTLEL